MTNRKQIQEQRMKGYFLDATKALLKSEGLKSVSVRNVAEKAGYSFATLYNYFKDVQELVFLCVEDFQQECAEHAKMRTEKISHGKKKIKGIVLAYLEYFVQYPGVFELFFMERMTDLGRKQPTSTLIVSFLDKLCSEEWDHCIQKQLIPPKEAEAIKACLQTTVTGLLLLYLNRHDPAGYDEFLKRANQQVDFLLDHSFTK